MDTRLTKDAWLRAARLALLHRGHAGVRVEALARDLGVTKGSFYWHFRDRADLLEALLAEWEAEAAILTEAMGTADLETALPALLEEIHRRTIASERGDWPSDAAIFAWAAADPEVARRVNSHEEQRIAWLQQLTGRPALAKLLYYADQGLLARRRRVPSAVRDFTLLADAAMELLTGKSGAAIERTLAVAPPSVGDDDASTAPEGSSPAASVRRRAPRKALAMLFALLPLLPLLQSCTTYRTVRWRDPAPNVQASIFPERIVRAADTPFRLVEGARRTDLDTVRVRDVDGQLRPFDEYFRRRKLRAFLVIRRDTVVYERYDSAAGYGPTTRSSSFSVAKSFTSALLGMALARGQIRSLDDSVTRYLPELARNPAYAGVTLRHLLGMQSGIAYSRTNGHAWHDLRSDDAHFYYTTDRRHSVAAVRRAEPPGTRWAYKDVDTEVLGLVLARVSGSSISAQLEQGIWRRIGAARDATFNLDRDEGVENVSSGLNATARDYALFGRLYLHGGRWGGEQLVPAEWVDASTTLDTMRREPEVVTWYRMQHQMYWWLPMHDWANNRDFFADGSRGQRIYVHPPTETIIVQLADESSQEFPFRKISLYLAGEPYRYPLGIGGAVLAAGRAFGGDSVQAVYARLTGAMRADPAGYTLNREGLVAVARSLRAERHVDAASAVERILGDWPSARAEASTASPQQR